MKTKILIILLASASLCYAAVDYRADSSGVHNFIGTTINTKAVQFDITNTDVPSEGEIRYNATYKDHMFGTPGGEQVAAASTWFWAKNTSGSDIPACSAVYISGGTGGFSTIDLADYTSGLEAEATVGLTNEAIVNNQFGTVITNGKVFGCDTSTFSPDLPLYLKASGTYNETRTETPYYLTIIGKTVFSNATTGIISVNIQLGFEFTDLHNVLISAASGGNTLYASASGGIITWKDTDILTIDDTNSRVGIGTATPGEELDVVGDIGFTGNLISSNSSNGLILKSPGGTSYKVTIDNNGSLTTTAL